MRAPDGSSGAAAAVILRQASLARADGGRQGRHVGDGFGGRKYGNIIFPIQNRKGGEKRLHEFQMGCGCATEKYGSVRFSDIMISRGLK